MLRCRILYALALAAGALFYIFYTGYLSLYLAVLLLALPFLSLAVSLPGMLGCTARTEAERGRLRRGEKAVFSVRLTARGRMPAARVTVKWRLENQLTGERQTGRERLAGHSAGRVLRREEACPHCGCVRFQVTGLWVCDLLGLFSLRRPLPAAAQVLVLPTLLPPEPVRELAGRRQEGVQMRPRPGGGPGEDYDLRPYRPGDPLRSVHWKLSSKLEDLVVRETLEPRHAVILLTLDRFGTPEELDAVLARLEAVSRSLLERELPHYVQWLATPGQPAEHYVADEAGLLACLEAACATRAPAAGPSLLDAPLRLAGADGPIRHLHLRPRGPEAEGEGAAP